MAKAGLTHDVFVANLPAHADQQAVRNLFSCFGEIEGVHLKNGKRGDGSKIAFLHFLHQTDANQAVEKQNGITWDGHTLLVQKSTKKDASKDQENKGEKCERKGKKQNKKNNVIGKKELGSLNSFKKKSTESKPALEEYTVLGTSDDALIVVHIEDPTVFYAQRVDLNPQLSDISKQLSKVCSQTVSVQGTPEMFKVYGAQFSEDQLWYRCEIMKNNIPGQCTVQYIDFGNREVISNKRIVELPDNLASVPPLAFKCQFKGLRGPMKDIENQQFQKGLQFLRKLTEGHIVYARLHPSPPGIKTVCCLLINCFVNGINLGQELIKNGYAFEVDDTEMSKTNAYSDCKDTKPLCGKKVKQGHWGRKNASRQQVSQDSSSLNSQFEKFGITKNIVGTKLNDQLGLIPPGDSGYNSGSNHSQFGVGDQFQNNVMIEHSASEEIKRLKAERDYLLRELTWEKEKLQAMKNELEKKTTDDISKKFTVILEKASKIKSLRCQLIYEKEQPDIIDLSISTVQNFQKDLASSNDKGVQEAVLEAHKTYNTCQAKLRSSTNKDEVQSLIEDRDSARRRFHEEIKQFLNSVSHQPNGERTTLLKALLSDLNKFYQPYLKMTCTGTVFLPLEEVASIYGNMKSQKQEEVQEVRRHTDAAGKKVSETLHVFHQLMKIE
ncbi:serine/threonine-protein kinase 31-like [Limulus polyphemus]|uniref:Serine/threonine-protein kinase 31-like n=1 Tax=Limulus polyphemus TaxID=6850 RepID=A0ABM1SZ55_LIMPO|nr:serine/threonine-protein kinase 31-like [Limulus polyphemus]